jgi:sterol desaturase/sphingolipid hydroxylase (fatty acid hydroxylase superfamily)
MLARAMSLVDVLMPFLGWQGPFAAALVFVPLERLLPLHPQRILRKGWKTDGAYIFINSAVFRFSFALTAAVAIVWLGAGSIGWSAAFLARQPLWLQAIGAVIVGDFFLYWAHRALHLNKFLWRFHSIHHAVEELDWAAAYHSHVIDDLVLTGAAFGSVALLGFSHAAIAIYGGVYAWISLVVHANTRLIIGPLRRVVSSPEFHHWHHSKETDARDRNFASIISFWDFAFGTAFLPEGRRPKVYGTDGNVPAGYIDQVLHPFRRQRANGQPAVASQGTSY